MNLSYGHSSADRTLRRRGTVLLGVAGGAATAVLLVALGTPANDAATEPVWVDTAPANTDVPAQRVAALDADVDWSRVERASEEAGASVAAYER